MRVILILCIIYRLQTQNTTQQSIVVSTGPVSYSTSSVTPPPNPSKTTPSASSSSQKNDSTASAKSNIVLSLVMPVKFPSSLNQNFYSPQQNTLILNNPLIFDKQACKCNKVIKNFTIKQYNTSYYMVSEKYFVSFKNITKTQNIQTFFTATQNSDCSWSIMSKQGLFLSLKPYYTYIMLQPKITSTQKFNFVRKNDYLYIQSASNTLYYWTAINGIGRLAKKQGSRFIIEIWLPSLLLPQSLSK